MSNVLQTRNIPALSMRAAFAPSSVNEEERTVDLVWTTGERVKRSSFWDGDFYEELSLDPKHVRMSRLESGRAPFLANHDSRDINSVLGVILSARLENGRGVSTVRFAKDDPAADAAWNKVRQGILPNVSVGYRIHRFEKVEGGDDTTPVFRATDWEPFEVSLVPMGADSMAHVRSAEQQSNVCTFITRGSPQQEKNEMTPEEIKAAEAKRQAELQSAAEAAAKAERARAAEIRKAVRSAGLGEDLAERMVTDGVALDAARATVLAELEKRTAEADVEPHIRAEITDDAKDKFFRGASSWFLEKAGMLDTVQRAEKLDSYNRKIAARGWGRTEVGAGEFRGARMADLARRFLELNGVRVRSFDPVKIFEQAYNFRSGYATTSDFSVLFESVLYKTLLAGYETQDDVWSRFCATREVQDFRPANFFRTGSFGALPPLNEHGEFENSPIPDGLKSTISIGTYGDIIAISRQAVINDDMAALADLAAQRGRDARATIEDKVFEQLALNTGLGPTVGGVIFFSATNANINTSAAANTAASWDLDAQKMGEQTDHSGNRRLNLTPEILLIPRAKKMEAQVLNASTVKVGGSNGEPNPAAGMAKDIVSTTRLSGTRRYWFANPARNPAILVGFLAGQGSAPVLSSEEGFRTDGTQFKTRLDFGVSFFDPKCAVTNAGA
jgi:HK97 family phage prohead protease